MDWQTLRNRFMRTIGGDPPGAQLEDDLIAAYTDSPDTVERCMDKIALAHKAGKIRSPWGALKAEVEKARDPARNPTHDHASAKARAQQRAEQWIRNAGLHYDRWAEVEDELFGPQGILHAHPELRDRMEACWNQHRPAGIATELEALERHRRSIENRAKLAQMRKGKAA